MIYGDGVYADVLREFIGDGHDHAWIANQTSTTTGGEPLLGPAYTYVSDICGRLPAGTLTIISTQLPVGSCAAFEQVYPALRFVVQPENVRVATAYTDFMWQARVVVGSRHPVVKYFERLFEPFTDRVLFMSPESAEMSKHAVNGYLALCIRYANELGVLCEKHGADPDCVIEALFADKRVSRSAPLRPGGPPSNHLLREVHTLNDLGAGPVIGSLL